MTPQDITQAAQAFLAPPAGGAQETTGPSASPDWAGLLTAGCTGSGALRKATTVDTIATTLFGSDPDALQAVETIVSQMTVTSPVTIPFRAHLMIRGMRGLWACSNLRCDQITPTEGRRVGKLWETPRSTCRCGGRVLELLYCFECGDVSLGGYIAHRDGEAVLLSTTPVSAGDRSGDLVFRRTHDQFRWILAGQRSAGPRDLSPAASRPRRRALGRPFERHNVRGKA